MAEQIRAPECISRDLKVLWIAERGGHWGILETAKPKEKIIQNRKTAKKFGQNRKTAKPKIPMPPSLKSLFDAFRRKPSFGAPEQAILP